MWWNVAFLQLVAELVAVAWCRLPRKLVTDACMLAQDLCLLKVEEDGVRISVPAPWSWEDEDGETDQ